MSEVLRNPWLLRSVLDDLSNDVTNQSGLNHLHRTPQLAQIIQFMKGSGENTHILAHLSDKFHYLVSFFSDQSLGRFVSRYPNWGITDIQGAIIRILEYRFVKVPCSGDSEVGDSVVLVIEDFEHVGSDGSPVFGDPRYVPCNPAVRTALQRPAPPSPSKKETSFDYSFTQSLDPTDLLFLETTCTQTLQRQSQTFPQVISDQDWRIPEDQIKILERIELIKLAAYEYSDVELSEDEYEDAVQSSPKRSRDNELGDSNVSFPLTQRVYDEPAHTQFNLPTMTQVPMTQIPLTQASSQAITHSDPQTQYSYSNLVFPETQIPSSASVLLDNSPKTPLRISKNDLSPIKSSFKDVIKTEIDSMNPIPSSPINSPIKLPSKLQDSPSKQANTSKNSSPSKQLVFEYPDYSSW